MSPLKAPGPDGLPALFYQKYWNVVDQEVSHLVLDILNNARDRKDINDTHIMLIPKCKTSVTPKAFKPISLCNMVMKIASKSIANRIKKILPDVVDEEQSGFVSGRLITDNALTAMECFHWLKKKKLCKQGMMALKLDMSKACDRLEWPFVIQVMSSMGFPDRLVQLIKRCITFVSYKILGQPSKEFSPKRGLWQGNPLSHYLFILRADVLSGLLKKEVMENMIHGMKVARKAPVISHLFFEDDCLLFSRASSQEADKIICHSQILPNFTKTSCESRQVRGIL